MGDEQQQLAIRRLNHVDRETIARLAQLDASPTPQGDLLGAFVDGTLVAALSLSTGESIANPFVPSEGARSILELRAHQLRPRRGRLFRRRRRRAARSGRSRRVPGGDCSPRPGTASVPP
jgi:hypothetical protein